MSDPLDEIRAKFRRAKKHHDEWHAAFDAWFDREPYGLGGQFETGAGGFVVRWQERVPPPHDLALVFADYVHNLRAVLDHIVWHLVVANGGEPTTETGFPVVTDRGGWQNAVDTRLRGVPEGWAEVVRDAQPFEVGHGAKQHPLYLLHRLDIASKHHNVVAMGVVGAGWLACFAFNRPAREGEEVVHVFAPPGTKLVDGIPLVLARCISEKGDLRVEKLEWIKDLDVGIGPISTLTEEGDGPLPNFLVFVGTVVEAIAPAFE